MYKSSHVPYDIGKTRIESKNAWNLVNVQKQLYMWCLFFKWFDIQQSNLFVYSFQDLPSFTATLHRFITDMRYYRLCNSALPEGSVKLWHHDNAVSIHAKAGDEHAIHNSPAGVYLQEF